MSSQGKSIDYDSVQVLVKKVDAETEAISVVPQEEFLPPGRVRTFEKKSFNLLNSPSIWRTGLGKIEIFVPSALFELEWAPERGGIHPFRVEENAWVVTASGESQQGNDVHVPSRARRPLLISRSLYSEAKPAGMLYQCSLGNNHFEPNEIINLRSKDFSYEISVDKVPWKLSETIARYQ